MREKRDLGEKGGKDESARRDLGHGRMRDGAQAREDRHGCGWAVMRGGGFAVSGLCLFSHHRHHHHIPAIPSPRIYCRVGSRALGTLLCTGSHIKHLIALITPRCQARPRPREDKWELCGGPSGTGLAGLTGPERQAKETGDYTDQGVRCISLPFFSLSFLAGPGGQSRVQQHSVDPVRPSGPAGSQSRRTGNSRP